MYDDDRAIGSRFVLSIELGNAAMLTAEDLADALESLAEEIRPDCHSSGISHGIRDENGNTVGSFKIEQ
jgi:hypothetical protein